MEEMKEMTLDSPIVATSELSSTEVVIAELERRVRNIEVAIGDRMIMAEGTSQGRKTIAVGSMIAKGSASDHSTVDSALQSLSVEQRIAVKGGLMRAGLL